MEGFVGLELPAELAASPEGLEDELTPGRSQVVTEGAKKRIKLPRFLSRGCISVLAVG